MTTIPIHEAQVRHQPLHAYVEEHAQVSPDRTAIVCGGSQLTFGQLQSQVEQLSAYLSEQGVSHGDTVALFMQNSPNSWSLCWPSSASAPLPAPAIRCSSSGSSSTSSTTWTPRS